MDVLIIGEYSGFSKNLKSGLEQLNCRTMIISNGDGWKLIKAGENDLQFEYKLGYKLLGKKIRGSWRLKALVKFVLLNIRIQSVKNSFDLVILINYEFIRTTNELSPKLTINQIKRLTKKGGSIFLTACGNDLPYLSEASKMRYWPYMGLSLDKNIYFSTRYKKVFYELPFLINGVIPTMYDYAFAYRQCKEAQDLSILKTIPLPIDCSKIVVQKIANKKLRVFHGINRVEMKGSDIIQEALESIEEKYISKVDVVIANRLPFDEYINLLASADIVIDQCKTYSYGMNAIYAMALGKVVFSGNEDECGYEFKRNDIPIINIRPNKEDIISRIEEFINQPQKLVKYQLKSRQFVEDFHDAKIVANQYLDLLRK